MNLCDLESQFIGVGRELWCLNVFLWSSVCARGLYTAKILICSRIPRMLVHDDNADELSQNISL